MNLKRISLILPLLLIFTVGVFAQSAVKGRSRSGNTSTTTVQSYSLTILSNTDNYTVYIDNQLTPGRQFKLTQGTHTITVKENGYQDWSQTINLTSNQTITANLVPNQHRLTIQTNTNSAIYINNNLVSNNSYNGSLNPGTYTVIIRSQGYMDYRATVVLDRDTNLVANLQPMTAAVNINLPQQFLNNKIGNPRAQIKIYDNGKKLKGLNLQLTPGNHTIRIESGGFVMEGNYNFEAGKTYNIEPVMYLNIN